MSSATNAHDERIHVIHNWAWEPVRLGLPRPMTDLLTDTGDVDTLDLGPWDVRVLVDRRRMLRGTLWMP